MTDERDEIVARVLARADRYRNQWTDRNEHYWFARLVQEVGELGSSIVSDHADTPDHELEQIASIAINWLRSREACRTYDAVSAALAAREAAP